TGEHLKTAGAVSALTGYTRFMPRGFFKNPNDLATYLVLYLPFIYVLGRYLSRKLSTFTFFPVLLLAAGTGIYLILQTGSRANMIALVPMALAAVALYLIQSRYKALRNITFLSIALVMGYSCMTSCVPEFANWSNRQYRIASHHLSTLEYAGGQESARVVLYRNAVTELKAHSFMGVGAGNAEEHMKKYRTGTFRILALHNWWLEILANYGIFVFVLYLTFYVKLLYELFVVAVRAGQGLLRVLGESCLLALVGFPIAAVSSSSLIYARFMWILFGIALCVVNIYQVGLKREEGDSL
ncbi:MAG: O-antigen ligase family protein, partial [Desulfotomaculaceae bacterium]|nr:O-antigen ligase family protein [Desulfotomaculaceae bacterium]